MFNRLQTAASNFACCGSSDDASPTDAQGNEVPANQNQENERTPEGSLNRQNQAARDRARFPRLNSQPSNQQHVMEVSSNNTASGQNAEGPDPLDGFRQIDKNWTTRHADMLNRITGKNALLALFEKSPDFVRKNIGFIGAHFDDFSKFTASELEYPADLHRRDAQWVRDNVSCLQQMNGQTISQICNHVFETGVRLNDLKDEHLGELLAIQNGRGMHPDMSAAVYLTLKHLGISEIHWVTSPFLRELLAEKVDSRPPVDPSTLAGVSRSTLNCQEAIRSELTEQFENNYKELSEPTLGMENEFFIPGLIPSDQDGSGYLSAEDRATLEDWGLEDRGIMPTGLAVPEYLCESDRAKLETKLGVKNYRYVKDATLKSPGQLFAPVEQVTDILQSPQDIARLQGALSILNDWGAITNDTSGVHIHTGVKQWTFSLMKLSTETTQRSLQEAWDEPVAATWGGNFPGKTITPLQLLLMKQFVVNMVSMQETFSRVAAENEYAVPNKVESTSDDDFYRRISDASDLDALIRVAQGNLSRDYCVNLGAYFKHGTMEVRGFGKKYREYMEVDPNLPIRDMVFLQEVLIKTVESMKEHLSKMPGADIELAPSEGLQEMGNEYVQDVFRLEIVHAVRHRDSKRRLEMMKAMVGDAEMVEPKTLDKVEKGLADVLRDDPSAQEFIWALKGRNASWEPAVNSRPELRGKASSREMADMTSRSTGSSDT